MRVCPLVGATRVMPRLAETEDISMASLSPGFHGRGSRSITERLLPGQYPTESFPVLSAGPTPHVPTDQWSFTVTSETGESRSWSWQDILALPQDRPVVDIHCVTRWSKFDTRWQGVSLDHLIGAVETTCPLIRSGCGRWRRGRPTT